MLLRSDLKYQFEKSANSRIQRRFKSLNNKTVLSACTSSSRWSTSILIGTDEYFIIKGLIVKNNVIQLISIVNKDDSVDTYVTVEFHTTHDRFIKKYLTVISPERLIICRDLNCYFEKVILSTAKNFKERQEEKQEILESLNVYNE